MKVLRLQFPDFRLKLTNTIIFLFQNALSVVSNSGNAIRGLFTKIIELCFQSLMVLLEGNIFCFEFCEGVLVDKKFVLELFFVVGIFGVGSSEVLFLVTIFHDKLIVKSIIKMESL